MHLIDRARRRAPLRRAFLALTLALVSFTGGCDNPGCVFSADGCSGSAGEGGIGEAPATLPENGEWIVGAAPRVERVIPTGTLVDTRAPIALVFSESLAATGLGTAFELVDPTVGLGVPVVRFALTGDGRVVCLFPDAPLDASTTYELRFRATASIQDRTGQKVVVSQTTPIGTFTTASQNATLPKVLGTYPANAATNQSATSEIVVFFDRPMQASTITDSSFVVTVEGNAPVPDPPPLPVALEGAAAGTDSRAWSYHSVDAQNEPVALGAPGDTVSVTLSPAGQPIQDTSAASLAETTFTFDLAPFSAPLAATIASEPADAIGIAQISGASNLAIEVELAGAQVGDFLQVYMFGTEPGVATDPRSIALAREIEIDVATTTFTLTAADVDLASVTSPLAARFADGEIAFAFQLRRGAVTSPLRRLDVDGATSGIQDPALDTVAPVLLGLGASGNVTSSFRSDLRDLVIVGRAGEELRAALVSTSAGETNVEVGGEDPPRVLGSHPSGLFIAAPVPVGVLPQAATRNYTLTVYDRALNASGAAQGTFEQIGMIALGNPMPTPDVSVVVFDATTLAPIAGARVITHQNDAGLVSLVTGGSAITDATGAALVPAATVSGATTILTVDATASGYDLFTFDGLPTDQIDVPLTPSTLASANVQGSVVTDDEDLDLYTLAAADSRAPAIGETLFAVGTCTLDPFADDVTCPFAPFAVRPREIGAASAVAVSIPANPFLYSHLTFLKAFGLSLPEPPVAAGASASATIDIPFLLQGAIDAEELPIDVPEQDFDSAGYPFDPLEDRPRVRVEARSPGVRGPVTIGRGIAFANGANAWTIRAAYPGIADGIEDFLGDALGRLVLDRTIDADLFLRIEAVDDGDNRGGLRLRLSNLGGAPQPLTPPAPPALVGTILNPGNVAFDLNLADVLSDAYQMPGLYRATLTDSTGRRWTLYHADRPDAAGGIVTFHVPYIGAGNTLPLAAGTLSVQGSAFAWESLDFGNLAWTDLDREFEVYAHATPSDFSPPVPP